MINSKRFFIPLAKIPSGTAQQRQYSYNKWTGRVMTYPSSTYKVAKRTLTRALIPFKPSRTINGPVLLEVEYRYETKDKGKQKLVFKTSKGDCDNLFKVFADCMNDLNFFEDDAQIAVMRMSKRWVKAGEGGIDVHIAELESEDDV